MIDAIRRSSVIIAEITPVNANVFYELVYEVYTCAGRMQHGLEHCSQQPVKRALIDGAVWDFFAKVALDIEATSGRSPSSTTRRSPNSPP